MSNEIVKFIGRFSDRNYRILGFEALLFSGVFGAAYQSWIVFGAMLLGLFLMLSLAKGKVYAMVALSGLWGIIAASIGHSSGSWSWTIACGVGMLLVGIIAHMKSLNLSVDRGTIFSCDFVDRSTNHRWRRQGLN
jgi:hypothetical protein